MKRAKRNIVKNIEYAMMCNFCANRSHDVIIAHIVYYFDICSNLQKSCVLENYSLNDIYNIFLCVLLSLSLLFISLFSHLCPESLILLIILFISTICEVEFVLKDDQNHSSCSVKLKSDNSLNTIKSHWSKS